MRFERLAFYLLLLSIPIQLGKHFWPDFSFVQGIRVDYLSPTFYVSDICFIFVFLFSINRLRNKLFELIKNKLFLSILFVLILGFFAAKQPLAVLYGLIKFLEFTYLAFYISQAFKNNYTPKWIYYLTLGALIQVVILVLQFFSQRSIGGLFYFLGERTFDASTPGIAVFRWADQLLLRPYGTFPHPNVLACFLFFVFVLSLFRYSPKNNTESYFKIIVLFTLFLGIILTFSRVIICLLIGVVIYWIFLHFKKKSNFKKIFLATSITSILLLIILFHRFVGTLLIDINYRLELLILSLSIFIKNPLIGVGLNNFYYHEVLLQKSVLPTLLQPVHNIYFLWLTQTGLIGIIILFIFLKRIIQSIKFNFVAILLFSYMIIGLFDHYLITLQQGQLLVALLLGLAMVNSKEKLRTFAN